MSDPLPSILAYGTYRPSATLRLFCLPFAGGGALTYRRWGEKLPASIELCPVQLPGRGHRMAEPPLGSMAEIVDHVKEGIAPLLDRPFALFGHSMGASVAFELCHGLGAAARAPLVHLFVSARLPPDHPYPRPPIHHLPEPEFKAGLAELNGTPAEVLANDELMELMLPMLRADFAAVETYRPAQRPPLDVPVTVFAGTEDPDIAVSQMADWARHTRRSCDLQPIDGDHFFISAAEDKIVAAVGETLRRWAPA